MEKIDILNSTKNGNRNIVIEESYFTITLNNIHSFTIILIFILMNPVLFPPYHKCNSFLDFLFFSLCVLLNEIKIGFLFQKKERINSLSLRSLYSFFSFPRLGLRWNEERIEDISTSSYFNISINIYFDKKLFVLLESSALFLFHQH